MQVYLDVVIVLNVLVDLLLLIGTNRLCGYETHPGRAVLSSALGGVYAGVCLLPGFAFLGNLLWRTVFLVLMSAIGFGFERSVLRRGAVFVLLSMALGGVAVGLSSKGFWAVAASAGCVCLLCAIGFRGRLSGQKYVAVELAYCGKQVKLTALRDTGNMLQDPITGKEVLVVGADIARKLTGLTVEQLRNPVENVGAIPGLRLIPYKAIGQESGMLLALKLSQVQIGSRKGSWLVAFAPEGLGAEGAYQGLTGGTV